MQVEKLSGNPKPLDILAKINQIIDNMVVSVNGNGTDENGNINVATIPVGFNYVQYPGESVPADLFGGEWENISSQFAGMFFRAEGGNAAEFGGSQTHALPGIYGTVSFAQFGSSGGKVIAGVDGAFTMGSAYSGYSSANATSTDNFILGFSAANSNGIYGAANEVRTANSTIRIWKRTA